MLNQRLNQRYFPKGSIKITPKNHADVQIGLYSSEVRGALRFGFIAYSGKRSKSDLYELHTTAARRDERLKQYFDNLERKQQDKLTRAGNRILKTNPVNVGDVFYTSWGYDQTNVDFFQVLSVKGLTVSIREIGSKFVEGTQGRDCSNVVADKDRFLQNAEPLSKKVLTYDGGTSIYLKIHQSANAWLWNGKPQYSSWYA